MYHSNKYTSGLTAVVCLLLVARCGSDPTSTVDSGVDTSPVDAVDTEVPTCMSASDCDDSVDCTEDSCASGTCQNQPLHSRCEAEEYCDPEAGCIPAPACTDDEDCEDDDPCTDEHCNDATRSCRYDLLDGDGDDDPPRVCGGTDCDDTNPWINGDAEEACNGEDDDCDGEVDEDFDCIRDGSEPCTVCGEAGTRSCNWECEWSYCEPSGSVTLDCLEDMERACTTTCGSTGVETCDATCHWPGTCVPPVEECNGADDDCDGSDDNGFDCAYGQSRPCTTTCGSTGEEHCSYICEWGSCMPPAEECNGVDDDCDSAVDETFACSPGADTGCTTSCGSVGSGPCTSECLRPTGDDCTPPDESCNGEDDDCDTIADEDFPCVAGTSAPCTTTCGSIGMLWCSWSCSESTTCSPPAEVCNDLDDDCDDLIDEGLTCCTPGELRCSSSGLNLEQCRTDGLGWDVTYCGFSCVATPTPHCIDCDAPPACPSAPADHSIIGSPCTTDLACGTGRSCFDETIEVYDGETYISWPGGACATLEMGSSACSPSDPTSCPAGTRCIYMTSSGSFDYYSCVDACSVANTSMVPYDWNCGCREGYACSLDEEVCLPGCSNDRSCCEMWDDMDDDSTRDPGEVLYDTGCTNYCDGNDFSEFDDDACQASFRCINDGDPSATFHSECLFDSDCPSDSRCINEVYYTYSTGEPYYPGGVCTRDRCDLVGRGCTAGLGGDCINMGGSADPFYACFAACQTGYGPGDPANPCRDDVAIPWEPYTCAPYNSAYWFTASINDGLCMPAVIPDGTDLALGVNCTDERECEALLGLGMCAYYSGAPAFCSVQCNQSLAEDSPKICGAAPSVGAEAPGVCWSGMCLAACHTPDGNVATNDCPQPMACFNNGTSAYGAYSFHDTDGVAPPGFCFPACVSDSWCSTLFGMSLYCNSTTGQCGL